MRNLTEDDTFKALKCNEQDFREAVEAAMDDLLTHGTGKSIEDKRVILSDAMNKHKRCGHAKVRIVETEATKVFRIECGEYREDLDYIFYNS